MLRKIVVFQKTLYRIFLTQFSSKSYELKTSVSKIEFYMQPFCVLIILLSGLNLMSGNIMALLCVQWLLMFLYKLICQDSFIFQLPLKRSFVVVNLYIFANISILLISVLFYSVITTIAIIPSWITEFMHEGGLPFLSKYDIAMYQSTIIMIAFSTVYTNVVTTFYFIHRIKIRIALTVIFTLVLSGMNFYTYKTLSNRSNNKYISLEIIFEQMHNSWGYVAVAVLTAIIVSGCGMFIAIRLDRHLKAEPVS